MKKYSGTIAIILFSVGSMISCKKSSDSTPPVKDYAASINDKTWWGTFTINGQTAQYYSVHFNGDNSLVWSQLSGDYPGKWTLDGKKLAINYTTNIITADVSDDGHLANIEDNHSTYIINNGELIPNPNIALQNTVWQGSHFNGSSQQTLKYSFSPDLKITITAGAFATQVHTYTRSLSGAVIRHSQGGNYPYFGVITSGSLMKGCIQGSNFPWQAFKQ